MKKFNIDQMFGVYSAEEDKTHVFAKGTSPSGKVLYAFVLDEFAGIYQFTTEKQMTEIFNALRKSGWKVLKTVKVEKQKEDAPKSNGQKKAAAPKKPAQKTEEEKVKKMAENAEKRDEAAGYERPKTRSEALEERRAFAIRRREVKDECYKLLCEEVKKSGKRLSRKVFCDRLEKMVKERMA